VNYRTRWLSDRAFLDIGKTGLYLLVDAAIARPSDDVLVILVTAEVSEAVAKGNVLDELGVVLGHGEVLREEVILRELICDSEIELKFLLGPSWVPSTFIPVQPFPLHVRYI
jgi:hypothetical protein